MNQGKYVFSQIVSFLPARTFDRCVHTFKADKWAQLYLMGTKGKFVVKKQFGKGNNS